MALLNSHYLGLYSSHFTSQVIERRRISCPQLGQIVRKFTVRLAARRGILQHAKNAKLFRGGTGARVTVGSPVGRFEVSRKLPILLIFQNDAFSIIVCGFKMASTMLAPTKGMESMVLCSAQMSNLGKIHGLILPRMIMADSGR